MLLPGLGFPAEQQGKSPICYMSPDFGEGFGRISQQRSAAWKGEVG
jgi:hypothetical protein